MFGCCGLEENKQTDRLVKKGSETAILRFRMASRGFFIVIRVSDRIQSNSG